MAPKKRNASNMENVKPTRKLGTSNKKNAKPVEKLRTSDKENVNPTKKRVKILSPESMESPDSLEKQELIQAEEHARKLEMEEANRRLEMIQQAADTARKRAALVSNSKKALEAAQRELAQKKQAFIEAKEMIPAALAAIQKYDYSKRMDILPTIPDDCDDEEQLKAYHEKVTGFHADLVTTMDAAAREQQWYFSPIWSKWFGEPIKAKAIIYQNVEQHFETARVYYLPHFISKTEIPRFLAAVPAVCTLGDSVIQLQSSLHISHYGPQPDDQSNSTKKGRPREGEKNAVGAQNSDPSRTFTTLSQAIGACFRLLNIFERRRSRMKCIASSVDVFATYGLHGKAPQRKTPKNIRRDIVAIIGVAPQLDVPYLDYADLVFEENVYPSRLNCYELLGQLPATWPQLRNIAIYDKRGPSQNSFYRLPDQRIFHVTGYLQTMKDSFFLWLRAFDDQVRAKSADSKGYLQIPAMGCDSSLFSLRGNPEGNDFSEMLMSLLVHAIEETLEDNYFPNIIKIGLCDYSGKALFCPTKDYIQHINLIPCPKVDLCQFENDEYQKYVCGFLVPGNSFSLPGNELGYESMEAMVGLNTSLRIVQSYIHNEHLLNPRNHIAVDGPCMLFKGREAKVKVPCIISDEESVQDYTWSGKLQPKITGEVTREGSF